MGRTGRPAVRRPATLERERALVEDAEWLLSWGTPPLEVARRLGTNVGALRTRLRRAGRDDLAETIRRAERSAVDYARAA